MKLQFLGTSGYGVTSTRVLPSLIVDGILLFDCGEGCLERLIKYGYDVTSLKAIFLTHLHPDHVLGVVSILFKLAFYSGNRLKESSRQSPTIYVPIGYRQDLEAIIRSTYTTFQNVGFKLPICELDPADSSQINVQVETGGQKYTIDYCFTQHNPKCLAYKINGQCVYTGDTGPSSDLISFVDKIPILIHEATFYDYQEALAHRLNHSVPIDVARLARKLNIAIVYLTHVPDLKLEDESKFLELASKMHPSMNIAHDGDFFQI